MSRIKFGGKGSGNKSSDSKVTFITYKGRVIPIEEGHHSEKGSRVKTLSSKTKTSSKPKPEPSGLKVEKEWELPEFKPAETELKARRYAKNVLGYQLLINDDTFKARSDMTDEQVRKANLDAANYVNKVLHKYYQAGYYMPETVKVDHVPDRHGKGAIAAFTFIPKHGGAMVVNTASGYLAKGMDHVKQWIKDFHQTGFISSGNTDYLFDHEFGHLQHWWEFSDTQQYLDMASSRSFMVMTGLSKSRKYIMSKVSRHAVLDAHEFVAEVFAGLVAGKRYDEKIMKTYKHYKGPKV